jgi:hypothetical protein
VIPAAEWARFGHGLIPDARRVLDDPAEVAVLNVVGHGPSGEYYVQWHGEEGSAFYLEAASGYYGDWSLTRDQQQMLTRLGWSPPGEGWGEADVWNWSRLFSAPVSLYEVIRLTVATLRDVYGAHPDFISVS